MSSKPGDELGSEGKWFGDDCERNGIFGSTPPLFDELREDLKSKSREETSDVDEKFHKFEDDGKRPPVAMETASTGDAMSDLFRKPMSDDGELYTSLLSNQSYPSGQDASYLSDDLKRSSDHSSQDTFDSYGIFGSPHTKTTTDLVDVMPKSLLGGSELKTEAYNYMDISHGDDVHNLSCPQPAPLHSLVDTGLSGLDSLGDYMDKSPAGHEEEEEENLGPALDSHSFPYVEEPSEDEELSDYRSYRNLGTPQTASPVKIILTESHPPAAPKPILPQANVSDNILSLGLQGVPTVTLSEPEDDSPDSSPNASPTEKESPSQDLFTSVPSSKPTPGSTKASEQDVSSAESGDSEIELVSEEPPLRSPLSTKSSNNPFEQSPSSKGGFSQAGNPFDNPPSAKGPTSYSILREEREAELDSELFIESANEESPKREGSGPKQGVNTPSPLILTAASPARSAPELVPAEPVTSSTIKSSNEKSKSPMKMEEDRPTKPKPPMATVPPEVRSEKPLLDDKHVTEGKGDLATPAAPVFMEGFDKQKTIDLLYWRNVKQSGAVFGSVLLLLFSLTQFSVVSVGAYLTLAALSASISFRIYKSVLQAVQKTDEGHPFKSYLEVEISLSQDQIGNYADKALLYANTCMKELRRLFLVQDLIDSLKFAVLMWLLTYVGALFNGLTLLILAVVSMFSMPIVYEKHQAQIDQYVGLIRTQVNSVVGKIQAKIPGAKRKEE
uniref:reticulon-1-like isoform X1 n=1 Tax=Oncorhynchus gorbuscha TaxID=8017 RepID=UPI001EAEEBA8|nr:reticulon-1-like isoform X1 [Oncorhynchus gorbuscha]